MGRRCVACTRRCSFRQAKMGALDAVEWAAAALPMMVLLPSEGHLAIAADSPSSAQQAKRQSKGECLHTRRCSCLHPAFAVSLGSNTASGRGRFFSMGSELSDERLDSECLGCQQCSFGEPHVRACCLHSLEAKTR